MKAKSAFAFVFALAIPAAAQQVDGPETSAAAASARLRVDPESAPRPLARAGRAAGPIRIDGRLDEGAWAGAQVIDGFVQSQPLAGHPASEPTVVRVLYDDRAIYIGAICYDSNPAGITVNSLEQDFESHDSDVFGVTLDTYLDRRNSFLFGVNPAGAILDIQTANDSRDLNRAWEGAIEVRTMIGDEGWTVEMAIPLTTLRFRPEAAEQSWGANFMRRIRRLNEESYWAPLERRDRLHKMSRAGTISGLAGLRPGRNVALKPFVLAANASGEAPADPGGQFDAGLDAKLALTPGLTLDLTYRTDFSQVEVDEEQVNLTRFSLFFPERREFFIENAGVFAFGDLTERNLRMGASPRDFTLFHSRRIGLDGNGRPIPILGGGRLTGRVGAFDVGILELQTEETAAAPPENFLVARVRRNVLGSSDVGAILVNRAATGGRDGYSRSYGVDANFRLWQNLVVHSYLAGSAAPGEEADGTAARLAVGWRDRLWEAAAFARRVDETFQPGAGFIRRRGVRQSFASLGLHPQPRLRGVQEVNPFIEVDRITNASGELETRELVAGFGVDLLDGTRLQLEGRDRFERLETPFRVARDVDIAPGDYGFRELEASYRSDSSRPFSANVELTRGGFFGGTRTSIGLGALWRLGPRASLDLAATRNDVRLPADRFDADVAAARLRVALSTRVLGGAFVQYNASTEQLVTNVRVDLVHAPLSDLFLVYSERRDLGTDEVIERTLTAKLTKLLAL